MIYSEKTTKKQQTAFELVKSSGKFFFLFLFYMLNFLTIYGGKKVFGLTVTGLKNTPHSNFSPKFLESGVV